MSIVKEAIPAAVSLAVVSVVTAILWYIKVAAAAVDLTNPVFFYLLPITIMAIVYGSRPALLGVIAAFAGAGFFLYGPPYSFEIDNRVELSDLTCFVLLAVIWVKCASTLFRPSQHRKQTFSQYAKR